MSLQTTVVRPESHGENPDVCSEYPFNRRTGIALKDYMYIWNGLHGGRYSITAQNSVVAISSILLR